MKLPMSAPVGPFSLARRAVVASLLLATLMACNEPLLPPIDAGHGIVDATQEVVAPDMVATDVPPLQTPQTPYYDPAHPRTQAEQAADLDKLKNNKDFDHLTLRPEVVVVSQKVASVSKLSADDLRVPFAGNEALMALKPDAVLASDRASAAERKATGSNNVFGYSRKIVSVQHIGDEIVIATTHAQLEDVFTGAVNLSMDLTTAVPIDVSGVDMSPYYPEMNTDLVQPPPPQAGAFQQKFGKWGWDADYTGDWGGQVDGYLPFNVSVKVKQVNVTLSGALYPTIDVGFKPKVSFGFDVNGFEYVNYFHLLAGGQFYGNAKIQSSVTLTIDAKGGMTSSDLKDLKNAIMGSEGPKAAATKDLFHLGPFAGPKIGPLTTSFLIQFVADCKVTASGTIKATVEGGVSDTIMLGFEYTHKDGVNFPFTNEFDSHGSYSIDGTAASLELECGFGPVIKFTVADSANLSLTARTAAKGSVDYTADCTAPDKLAKSGPPPSKVSALIKAGMSVVLKGEVEIAKMGITIWNYEFLKVKLWEKWWDVWSDSKDLGDGLGTCPSNCENGQKDAGEGAVDCGGVCPNKCPEGATCNLKTDCPGALFCSYGVCNKLDASNPCNDGKKGPDEWDIDCGPTCGKCKAGQYCNKDDMCASGNCLAATGFNYCVSYSCTNGVLDPGETDIDCGDKCTWQGHYCGAGKKCATDFDCTNAKCTVFNKGWSTQVKLCAPGWPDQCDLLADGKVDGNETDQDCGGPCAASMSASPDVCITHGGAYALCGADAFKCYWDKTCTVGSDCQSGFCKNGVCDKDYCKDGAKDLGETDVDCGGPCAKKCAEGKHCNLSYSVSDCEPLLNCSNWDGAGYNGEWLCRKFYQDGYANGGLESDVDCGGKAPAKCPGMGKCGVDTDCGPGLVCAVWPFFTNGQRCLPAGNCSDGKMSGTETDVDCGLGCKTEKGFAGLCGTGKQCQSALDCKSMICDGINYGLPKGYGFSYTTKGMFGTCGDVCNNGKPDWAAGEGDVDCGGPCPNKCKTQKNCSVDDQCVSGVCATTSQGPRCSISTCGDGLAWGGESDVDCGGPCTQKCAGGQKCKTGFDCASGVCGKGVCIADLCGNGVLDAGETDIDCGGSCGAICKVGAACKAAGDCTTATCASGKCTCPVAQFWNSAAVACQPCTCSVLGSTSNVCSSTGQCTCKTGWTGRTCSVPPAGCTDAACTAVVCAAPIFPTPTILAAGTTLDAIAAVDLNGDGVLDLVFAEWYRNSISVALGKAGGGYAATVLNTVVRAGRFAVGDVNGDKVLDLVAARSYDKAIDVLIGKGDGTFAAATEFAVGTEANDIAAIDVNGDKKLDVLALSQSGATVSVFLGNGDGTFKGKADFATAATPNRLAAADFDGDGKLDLAVSAATSVSVLLGNGDGTFKAKVDAALASAGAGLAVADLNGDAKLDLAVALPAGLGAVAVLLNAGKGAFVAGVSYATATGPGAVAIADVNGDKKADVLVSCSISGEISMLLGNGDGTLKARIDYPTVQSPAGLVLADVTADAKLDVVVASAADAGLVGLLPGNGDGTFGAFAGKTTGAGPYGSATADFNGDGKPDMVVADAGAATVSVLLGKGAGALAPKVDYATGKEPRAVAVGDFNGDKKTDIFTANFGGDSVSVLLGNGDGTFKAKADYATGAGPRFVAVGDLTGDGQPDLAVANEKGNSVSLLGGYNTGSFQGKVDYAADGSPQFVAIADLNGDQKPDVAVVNNFGRTISVFLNAGGSNVSVKPGVLYAVGAGPSSLAIGDVNGDAKLDLVVSSSDGGGWHGEVDVLFGKGDGTFKSKTSYEDSTYNVVATSIALADYNGDGRPDVAVTWSGGSVGVALNLGDGRLQMPTVKFTTGGSLGLVAADLNSDGKLDLFTTNNSMSAYTVLPNGCAPAVSCSNGKLDAGEGDIDCGQTCPNQCADGKACASGADCQIGVCFQGKCGVDPCANGKKDAGESDVDCGHVCANNVVSKRCPVGKGCALASDCASWACDGTACVATTCEDKQWTYGEADVDCGTVCPNACADGKHCLADLDCKIASCFNSKCAIDPCKNGKKDIDEADIDCGQVCPTKCAVGQTTLFGPWECASGVSDGTVCVATTCQDKKLSPGEAYIDCGGVCATKCVDGATCKVASDCVANLCTKGLCGVDPCGNGKKDLQEADLDCGGVCATKCAVGKLCPSGGADCTSGVCNGTTCVATTCEDKKLTPGEGDIDCGSVCSTKCPDGKSCKIPSDCQTGQCFFGVCGPDPCADGKKGALEADIDCGGHCPKKCGAAKTCTIGSIDCTSNICQSGLCTDSCKDGVWQGAEADIDCGGVCTAKCALGKRCPNGTSDCASGFCDGMFCVASACLDKKLSAGETAVDCGGVCSAKCANFKGCAADTDCSSGFCNAIKGTCAPDACSDAKKESSETDIDCGGACWAVCALGQGCAKNTDCTWPQLCDGTVCVADKCLDKQLDNYETDMDCGGFACAKRCSAGQKCGAQTDCDAASFCKNGLCTAYTGCSDGVQGPGENGPDCGGVCGAGCGDGFACNVPKDCVHFCNVTTHLCGSSSCFDKVKSGAETDVDCGGGGCAKCGVGQACSADNNCGSNACVGGLCVAVNCANSVQDGNETDVDCGGACSAKCANGKHCGKPGDCLNQICSAAGTCVGSYCVDGKLDYNETDVDCGGSCPKCAIGAKCAAGLDCSSGACVGGVCIDFCFDGALTSGKECGVDCGLSCAAKCPLGAACAVASSCASGFSNGSACVATGCEDKQLSPGEASMDCGGVCAAKCASGKGCALDGDCASGFCNATTLTCASGPCYDAKKESGETDIDCGGVCSTWCAIGKGCAKNTDCAWPQLCDGTVCVSDKCIDKQVDNYETDIDCGGISCAKRCSAGQKCATIKDCDASSFCKTGTCTAFTGCSDGVQGPGENGPDCGGVCPTGCANYYPCSVPKDCLNFCDIAKKTCSASSCADQLKDGTETDIDCGGSCVAKCAVAQACKVNGDCASTACVGGACVALNCSNGVQDGNETDVDCGGSCSAKCAISKHCSGVADCLNGICSVSGTCVATYCQDGKQNGNETDVDCGHACTTPCALGLKCSLGWDCASGACVAGLCIDACFDGKLTSQKECGVDCGLTCAAKCPVGAACWLASSCASGITDGGQCVATTCQDKLLSPGEAAIDCGGVCATKCLTGKACGLNSDCVSGFCSALTNVCVNDGCSDGKKDQNEGDVDCGFACINSHKWCAVGQGCAMNADCLSSYCDGTGCVSDPCVDKQKDGVETDVDCGGILCAKRCAAGQKCSTTKDCAGGYCKAGICTDYTGCADGVQGPGENGVDCGGVCPTGCANGYPCLAPKDCLNFCNVSTHGCQASSCNDQIKSGSESDIDCGGSCPKCALLQGCTAGGDCVSGICNGSVCVAQSCADGIRNGAETDIDCGGTCVAKCSTGKICAKSGDCVSQICSAGGTCVLTTCDDGKLDGSETDVDCGGTCKTTCLNGAKCAIDSDCYSAACATISHVCTTTCLDQKKDAGETDVDCGGSCALACGIGQNCVVPSDCASKACSVADKCVSSTCVDGKLDGDETALDCGGSCAAKCAYASACKVAADCATGACAGTCTCLATQFWSTGSSTCAECGCSAAGSTATSCDAGGQCACKPGWGGLQCDVKTDVCVADQLNCDDANVCTGDSCNPQTGCTHVPVSGGCDDGNACTQSSACLNGACAGADPVVCAAVDQCHLGGGCNPATGTCSVVVKAAGSPCEDGNPCTTSDGCFSGVCFGGATVACSASDGCHDVGTCDAGTGACSNPVKSDGAACSDGNACTQIDTCSAGSCVGASPVVCSATGQCDVVGLCDTGSGLCSTPAKPDGSTCSDGDACTTNDTCKTGACVSGSVVVCTASDQCHSLGVCNGFTGVCSNPAKANGSGCDDGKPCTTGEACQSGTCSGGSATVCNDGNPCTNDSCNVVTGCVFTNNTASCTSCGGSPCVGTCSGGSCSVPLSFAPVTLPGSCMNLGDSFHFADMNKDGKLDLVTLWYDGSYIPYASVFLKTGTTFSATAATDTVLPTLDIYGTAVQDISGDGVPDLVATGPDGSTTSFNAVLKGKNNGFDTPVTLYTAYADAFYGWRVAISALAEVFWMAGEGDPRIGKGLWNGSSFAGGYTTATGGSGVQEMALADVEKDGDTDVFIAVGPGLTLLRNNGVAGWTRIELAAGVAARAVAAGDFNGDGKIDVAYSKPSDVGKVFVKLGDGGIGFGSEIATTVGTSIILQLASGDINGDGKTDLVSGGIQDGVDYILLSNGAGGFSLAKKLPFGNDQAFPKIVDVNGDGKKDVAIRLWDQVVVYQQQ